MKPISYKKLTEATEAAILERKKHAFLHTGLNAFDQHLKCQLQANEILCFWIRLTSAEGVRSQAKDRERLEALIDWVLPATPQEVK